VKLLLGLFDITLDVLCSTTVKNGDKSFVVDVNRYSSMWLMMPHLSPSRSS
jgi:hypothetical protein